MDIVYVTINNKLKRNDKGQIKKIPNMDSIKYKNILCKRKYNSEHNSCLIMLGERYNLIGVDVDNKEDTIEKYNKIMEDNNALETLTIKTVNKGYHYYYRLTDKQKEILNKINFNSKNDAIFDLHIDIKYNNQIFFGPSRFNFENRIYKYKIYTDIDPIILPNFIFDELISNYKCKKCKQEYVTKTKLCDKCSLKVVKEKEEKIEEDVPKVDETILEKYLDCLKSSRFSNYETWLYIGAIIYNENGSLEMFKKYSQKVDNYDKKACEDKWNEYKKHKGKKATVLSLMKWAHEDNPKKFSKVRKDSISYEVNKMLTYSWSDNNLSQIFRYINPNNIIYCNNTKEWYILNQYNIWECDCDLVMINMVSDTLPNIIRNEFINMYTTTDKNSKEYQGILKIYKSIYKYCTSISSQKNIVEKLKSIYYDKTFSERVDNVNNYLFCFKNGAYDLQTNQFRLPKPEELISQTTDYNYDPTINDDKMKQLNKIIDVIFLKNSKDEEGKILRDYVMTTIAQCLSGVVCCEDFFIWSGNGRNGKGIMRDLIKATFSLYFDPMGIEELDKTRTSSSNSADINMARKRHARIVITTEPDSAMQLKANKIAEWTGGDPITCRYNYDRTTFNYVPKWKLFIQTNYDLSFPGKNIKAFTERTNMVRYPFCFVRKAKLENEKLKDPHLKETLKDPLFKITFFHLLLSYYKKYVKNNRIINPPKSVKEETAILFTTADPVTPFFEDMIEKTDSSKDYISSSDLYNHFKNYYNGADIKVNTQEFKACLKEKGLKPCILKGRVIWRNIILKPQEKNKINGEFIENHDAYLLAHN